MVAELRDRAADEQLAALDAISIGDSAGGDARTWPARLWAAAWPKLAAITLVLLAWQCVVWFHWRPSYVLPGPLTVMSELRRQVTDHTFWLAVAITLRRALVGYAIAVVSGLVAGTLVAQSRIARSALGSLTTGLQTMPSIAWFPLAILLFKLSESAILFVVVLGAAPSVINGVIAGVDHVPPLHVRAGRVLGARGLTLYRHVIIPAALPSILAGLKQAWAFAWRSLMAGELLVIIAKRPSIGARLQFARELSDAPTLLALMIVVLALGVTADALFNAADRRIRSRRGLLVG